MFIFIWGWGFNVLGSFQPDKQAEEFKGNLPFGVSGNFKIIPLFKPFGLKELKMCRERVFWHLGEGEKLHLFLFSRKRSSVGWREGS